MGVHLDDRQVSQFVTYREEILLWNKRINLISERSSLDIPVKHFIDSLTVLPFIPGPTGRILDIGSGGGFPALPLKIAAPRLEIHLVESTRKKASFLKQCVRSLGLDNVTIIAARIEDLATSACYGNAFDAVTSRAAFKLPALIPAAAPFLRPGGLLIAMKGADASAEVSEAATIQQKAGLAFLSQHELKLPLTGDLRTILLYRKAA